MTRETPKAPTVTRERAPEQDIEHHGASGPNHSLPKFDGPARETPEMSQRTEANQLLQERAMELGWHHGLRYNEVMAQALEKALTAVAELSEEEQSRLGEWILAELAAERAWNDRFTESSDLLASLAKEALAEHARGETTDLHTDDK